MLMSMTLGWMDAEAEHEYGITPSSKRWKMVKYDAVILAVAHRAI